MIAVGIDVGGTRTRVAVVDHTGRILAGCRVPTPDDERGEEFIHAVFRMVGDVVGESSVALADVRGVGLALPGIVDRDRGMLVRSVNMRALEGRPIRDDLARRLERAVLLMTDAEAATWGEYTALEKPPRRFVHLRLGTGIACGVVLDGKLQRLNEGRTTHLPALIVEIGPDAKPCPCGLTGCLETVASGSALLAAANRAGFKSGLVQLRHSCEGGDDVANGIVARATAGLAVAFDNLVECFRADVVTVGGGVVDQLPALIDAATTSRVVASRACPTTCSTSVSIERSRLSDDAGVIGAALLAMER